MDINVKQKNTKVIKCDRCGCTFTTKTNLRKHFNRKNICKPLLENIPIETLKEKHKVNKGCYKCENCGKEYKSRVGKCKHKKKCLLNPNIIEKKTIHILKNELEQKNIELGTEKNKREELEQQVKQLLLEKYLIEEKNAKIINNIGGDNITLNIVYNDYKDTNLSSIKNNTEFIKKCIENPLNSVRYYLDEVHYNKNIPENKNIKLTNLQSPFMDYVAEGKWNKIEQKLLLPNIINKSIEVIADAKKNVKDISFTNENEEKWYEYKYNTIKNKPKDVLNKTKRHIYNNTD